MRYFLVFTLLSSLPILNGCNPTLNWRDVRPDQTPLVALFPCKPDVGNRKVSLGAKDVKLTMLGCKADDATFTLAYADMTDTVNMGSVLVQWKEATLGSMRAKSVSEVPFSIQGASVMPESVQVEARGTRQNGSPLGAQAVWFARGSVVYQAVVYADTLSPAVAETYFAGLRLQ